MEIKEYFLVDTNLNIDESYMNAMCEVIAKIALLHNSDVFQYLNYEENDDLIKKYWTLDKIYPSCRSIISKIKLKNVKWYIRNRLEYHDENGWNPDFLFGISQCGKLKINKSCFPTFEWRENKEVENLIRNCPFAGKLCKNILENKKSYKRRWKNIPAFYLKCNPESLEFLAGILATGEKNEIKRKVVFQYSKKLYDTLYNLGIPIENKVKKLSISPIWPALFTKYMPNNCNRDRFLNIENGYNSEIYSIILWWSYIGTNFACQGIPYLPSRRTIFYNYKCEEGAINKIKKLRLEYDLTRVDNKIIKCIQEWSRMVKKCA